MRNGRRGGVGGARLCALAELRDGETRLFATAAARGPDFFVVRRGAEAVGYVNDCPHANLPLDLVPGRFLDPARARILCTNHGALFDIDTGVCVRGPCFGKRLVRAPLSVHGGDIRLAAETAGPWSLRLRE